MTIGIRVWFLHHGRWTFFTWVYEKMILGNFCVPCILRFITVGFFFFFGLLVGNLARNLPVTPCMMKLKNLLFLLQKNTPNICYMFLPSDIQVNLTICMVYLFWCMMLRLFTKIILYDNLDLLAFDKAELKYTRTIFCLMQSPYLLQKKKIYFDSLHLI